MSHLLCRCDINNKQQPAIKYNLLLNTTTVVTVFKLFVVCFNLKSTKDMNNNPKIIYKEYIKI